MSDSICYIGAYLEVKVKKVKSTYDYYGCVEGHVKWHLDKYCNECGHKVTKRSVTMVDYPTTYDFLSLVLDKVSYAFWKHRVNIPELMINEDGTFIIKGNSRLPHGCWTSFQSLNHKDVVLEFENGLETMVDLLYEFHSNYVDLIKAVSKSSLVVTSKVKFGMVFLEVTTNET